VLRLSIHSDSEDSKITPVRGMKNSDCSSVYPPTPRLRRTDNAKQLRDKNHKGGLSMPETVSVYVQRWLSWVKSIYGKENNVEKALFNRA